MDESYAIKTEMQSNGEILLFYVDENGGNEEGVLTTIENIEQGQLEELSQNCIIEEAEVSYRNVNVLEQASTKDRWTDDEIKRLLIFYIDNKEAFQNGLTRKSHLWTVACKTMLTGKNATSCETKLKLLKRKYASIVIGVESKQKLQNHKKWLYDLCHQAFHDDQFVTALIEQSAREVPVLQTEESVLPDEVPAPQTEKSVIDEVVNPSKRRIVDKKAEQMLTSYLQHKERSPKDHLWQKNFWLKIAIELGEDADYWHKRFLNFKQHYIRMLDKRKASAEDNISWPYMSIFDKIFAGDDSFHQRYGAINSRHDGEKDESERPVYFFTDMSKGGWNDTEKTVLVKYYFDCYDEFQDPTIPKSILWNDVSRLLEKNADECREKYLELKDEHLNLYIEGGYSLRTRKPIAILFDNVISKETQSQLSKKLNQSVTWDTDDIDLMVNFFYDNVEVFKDDICHFVCYAAVAKKLSIDVKSCRRQWEDLVTLYKSILEYKKEDSDLQIDWRYIDLFDRVFDYGMDMKLLEGYEKPVDVEKDAKTAAKKTNDKENLSNEYQSDYISDEEYSPDNEKTSNKRSRGTADPKQVKILEYYFKNKKKFSTTQRKKQLLWRKLAKQLGFTAEQCAHRLRNLKQVYFAYLQREIDKPEKPILWPYYALCKKVFGYQAVKNKLKTGKSGDDQDWFPEEINQLIEYFNEHFNEINSNSDELSHWSLLATKIGKPNAACRDKFIELRKSYRKIKTMVNKNPDCKVTWKYFKTFDDIYKSKESEPMEVDANSSLDQVASNIKSELQEDEDYQCIIVMPDGEVVTDLTKAQIVLKQEETKEKIVEPRNYPPWGPKAKKKLLRLVLQYAKDKKGQEIVVKEMWRDIASKLPDRTPKICQDTYYRLRKKYKGLDSEGRKKFPYAKLMEQILDLIPEFVRTPKSADDIVLTECETYTDISLPMWMVERALQYYLDHLEEFVHPKYVHKYSWIEMEKYSEIGAPKLFKKINYLKQFFDGESKVNGEPFEYSDLLKKIIEKEFELKIAIATEPEPVTEEEESFVEWSDTEIEQLLVWYLDNLDKFKSKKYVTSYLWMEASKVLNKSAVSCSKTMTEIRSQYSTMVKENPDEVSSWKFYELCQKIYGTGKKTNVNGE